MFTEEMKKLIENELNKLNEYYKELSETEHELMFAIDDSAKRRAEITKEVLEEVDEQGRNKYRNDMQREAEITIRLNNDAVYSELHSNYRLLKLKSADLRRKIDFQRFRLRFLLAEVDCRRDDNTPNL